ncbi:MAG: nitrogen regulation protein NR(II), partial [Candidatus Tectimicrobiota bacterium]
NHLKEAQLQLLEQERLTAVGQCAADIAHEIRNPLVAIGGFARRLMDRARGDPSSARYSRIIVDETVRLERILGDLLIFTQDKALQMASLDLNAVVEEVLSLSEALLTVRNIFVTRRLAPDLPAVLADHDHLQQVFLNLTTNAEQAMPDGGRLTVTTFAETHDGRTWVCCRIDDTGTGVEPALLDRILDPFFSTKAVGEGTGLGLSICKKIVEGHGGTISVASVLGEGATVTVRLPAAQVAEPAPVSELEASRGGTSSDAHVPSEDASG